MNGRCPPIPYETVKECAKCVPIRKDSALAVLPWSGAWPSDAYLQSTKLACGRDRVVIVGPFSATGHSSHPLLPGRPVHKTIAFAFRQLYNPVVPSLSGFSTPSLRWPPNPPDRLSLISSYILISPIPPTFAPNMSNVSPSAMLLWGILSIIELIFLFVHLWRYDRLQVSHSPSPISVMIAHNPHTVSEVELRSESRCLQEGNDLWVSFVYPVYWCATLRS